MYRINSSPDWVARIPAWLGLGLTAFALYYTHLTYRAQNEERILVRLAFIQALVVESKESNERSRGEVKVEVVNIGMHPIYIKDVNVCSKGTCAIPLADDAIFAWTFERMTHEDKQLGPSEAAYYTLNWNLLPPSKVDDFLRRRASVIGKDEDIGEFLWHLGSWDKTLKFSLSTDESGEIILYDVYSGSERSQDYWVRVETTKKIFLQHPISTSTEIKTTPATKKSKH